MKRNKQNIRCEVADCKHCDIENVCCNLKEIKISNCNSNKEKEATMCENYNIRKD